MRVRLTSELSAATTGRLLRQARALVAAAAEAGDSHAPVVARRYGRVVAFDEIRLAAALSRARCLGYTAIADEWSPLGRTLVAVETNLRNFAVADQAGRHARVEPEERAIVLAPRSRVLHSGYLDRANDAMVDFLFRTGERPEDFVGAPRSLRYVETTIRPDDEVAVCGLAAREPTSAPEHLLTDYRGVPEQLVFRPPPGAHLIVVVLQSPQA